MFSNTYLSIDPESAGDALPDPKPLVYGVSENSGSVIMEIYIVGDIKIQFLFLMKETMPFAIGNSTAMLLCCLFPEPHPVRKVEIKEGDISVHTVRMF